jgi:hypothetical protein
MEDKITSKSIILEKRATLHFGQYEFDGHEYLKGKSYFNI